MDFVFADFRYLFYLLPAFFIVVVLLINNYLNQKKLFKILTFDFKNTNLLSNFSLNKKTIKISLISISFILLIFSLMRPRYGVNSEKIKQKSRDLFIALDISRSMLSGDFSPNRLEFAKKKIKDLINYLNSERVGLMIFASSALIQSPLTSDYVLFKSFLDSLDADTVSNGSTDISQALSKAVEVFENSDDQQTKLLFILTDGEDFSANIENIKHKIESKNIHVITMGIGTLEGAPVPIIDAYGRKNGHEIDANNNIVISKLNEIILKDISNKSGGVYLRATKDDADVKKIQKFVEKFEAQEIEEQNFNLENEKYYYFTLISLILLILEWLI